VGNRVISQCVLGFVGIHVHLTYNH